MTQRRLAKRGDERAQVASYGVMQGIVSRASRAPVRALPRRRVHQPHRTTVEFGLQPS